MDPELPGSEKPGAILDYVKESKEEEKLENKEINIKVIKKKIFGTELFADRYKSGVNINNNDINRSFSCIGIFIKPNIFVSIFNSIFSGEFSTLFILCTIPLMVLG